ncbi:MULTISPECIES: O-methyltransferase [unclassified Sporosarcina]|uniref:O-methyltransferase n=1 Tax=unclassified Sporosarcina TaxID=2647733 RepID=UPI000C1651D7|nr:MULTISPECIES: O-methyltransferase [unclassified Sporosarcina]PID00494.1 SAM-dependent methyltransferase [Sporosarcina sp. P29]PID05783.1 SAM-dependent methyltransferase [Sporosarcina sp. P30]PID08977.1 SAM-dependent methyltransferase [Sporosarcina sp. P31]PID12063.1 SAM-dependent methyltransferase [Sporosarcina sp. P32b]
MTDYNAYISRFAEVKEPLVLEMEHYAAENRVPIMDDTGLYTLIGLLQIQQPKRILEIGSAIGYSAIRLAKAFPDAVIYTIERDAERYEKAVEHIERSGLQERITIIQGDALELDEAELPQEPFDTLFIDAAKGQYRKFFDKYSPLVGPAGVIYCDNMFMHGMVLLEDGDIPKRNRTMIRNLQQFTSWAMQNNHYETSLVPIGDGILIAVKKE